MLKEVSLIVNNLNKVKSELDVILKDIESRENDINSRRENVEKFKLVLRIAIIKVE